MAIGVFWSLTSALLWATVFVAARHLLSTGRIDPVSLSLVRFAIGAALLLAGGLVVHGRRLWHLSVRDAAALAGLGLCGMAGMSVLLFYGAQTTASTHSAIIMQLSPIFILLLGAALGEERIRPGAAAGIALAFAGSLLVVGVVSERGLDPSSGSLRGNLLVLASALCWSLYAVLGRPLVRRRGGYVTTTWAMVAGAVFLLLAWWLLPGTRCWPREPDTWGLVLYLAVFPTAIAFFAWYEAMRHIPLSLLNVMQYITPACTLLLAWLLLGERLQGLAWGGVALIALGIALVSRPRPATPAPGPMPAAASYSPSANTHDAATHHAGEPS